MTDFWGQIFHPATLARGYCGHRRQKRTMKRGGQCFDKSQHFEQTGHGCTGFTFTGAPLTNGEHGDAEIFSGPGFVKVQAFDSLQDLSGDSTGNGLFRLFQGGFVHGWGFLWVRSKKAPDGLSGATGYRSRKFSIRGKRITPTRATRTAVITQTPLSGKFDRRRFETRCAVLI